MSNEFLVIEEDGSYSEANLVPRVLFSRNLYKSLSIYFCQQHGVNTPNTALFLQTNLDRIHQLVAKWNLPIMIRMDYDILPPNKSLGGIPIYNTQKIISISKYLFDNNCYPLLHPHIDRFQDLYSVGMLINKNNYNCLFEIVGEGFDASDLRLGSSIPHETIEYDLLDDQITLRRIISDYNYDVEKKNRKNKIIKFKKYISYANETGYLLSSLDRFDFSDFSYSKSDIDIPYSYKPLSSSQIKKLAYLAFIIKTKILPHLPASENYVASFSFTDSTDWILWDIYGSWYKR